MLNLISFLQIFSKFCCLELINFGPVFQPELEKSFQIPILRTNFINRANIPSIFNSATAKSRICNSCSAQVSNFPVNLSNFFNLINTLKRSTFTKQPTFRIFIDFRLTQSITHFLPQTQTTSPIEPNILAQFQNNTLQSVYIFRANKFTELCRHGCNKFSTRQDFLPTSDRFNLDNEYGTLLLYGLLGRYGTAEKIRADRVCSDMTSSFVLKFKIFAAYEHKMCLVFYFMIRTNVTLVKFDPTKKHLGFLHYVKFYPTPGKDLALNIFPHGQKHDGLFYSVFVNKSELVSDIKVTKPFDGYVWVTFLSSGFVLAVTLCKLLEKSWTQLGSVIIWIFAIALEQTDEILENQVRNRVKLGSVIIAMWSGMMIVLMNSYTSIFYSFLMSDVTLSLPSNLGGLLNIPSIKLYTFHNPNTNLFSISVDNLFDKVPHLKEKRRQIETIRAILGNGLFGKTVFALAFEGLVRRIKISGRFITFQNSKNLREFSRLIKQTGRFVEVRNTNGHLVNFRCGWVSSRDRVGQVFGNVLVGLQEAGIYSYWINRWEKFMQAASMHDVREGILKYNGGRKIVPIGKDVPFSLWHLWMDFALLGVGFGAACIAQLIEKMWELVTKFKNIVSM
ncbi:hypothetical protein Fcan01_21917 [Folsomia candida]|uniref:Uncharacterized protein n=1 Tax=Folsomia candida TaxID=158441 RepID=A0A226DC29_FOLCA|nr:hypothetical protein Fcan01_21917 [Folsomia candida]